MSESAETIYSQEYFDYLHSRSPIRKLVRKFYLNNIRKYCSGKTIDFGCGTGELLKKLSEGSVGFEVNKVAVLFCNKIKLPVELYNPEIDNYEFRMIGENQFQTFTMNHVLEHIKDSHETIRKIFESCHKLGIQKLVFTVPGIKGFNMDKTHLTFIDINYFQSNNLLENRYYKLIYSGYFPFNSSIIGKYFRHNELRLVFEKRI
jgi:SAM-dependent methyltransferase